MKALYNGRIFNGQHYLPNKAILCTEKTIVDIVEDDKIPSEYQKIDLKNNLLCAGLIDLQLNGCGGVLFNDSPQISTLETMNKTNLQYGCRWFLPTLITDTDEKIKMALNTIEETLQKKHNNGVLGMHLEGPYISKEKNGIHDRNLIRNLDDEMLNILIEYGRKDVLKVITICPENVSAEQIHKLSQADIIVSLGHSNASYEATQHAIEAGATMATHLYNAMPHIAGREPGLITALFNNKNIYCGIIIDGFHVSYPSIRLAKNILQEHLFLITDAASPAGTTHKEFTFAGQKITNQNGKLTNQQGTLAGSSLVMTQGLQNIVNNLDISLEEAIRMSTIYPARAINMHKLVGKIDIGYKSAFTILDSNLNAVTIN